MISLALGKLIIKANAVCSFEKKVGMYWFHL